MRITVSTCQQQEEAVISKHPKNNPQGRRGKRRQNGAPNGGPANGRNGGNGRKSNPQANLKRYTDLAREAASAGDLVQAEYYYQHADHYQRIISQST